MAKWTKATGLYYAGSDDLDPTERTEWRLEKRTGDWVVRKVRGGYSCRYNDCMIEKCRIMRTVATLAEAQAFAVKFAD